MKAKFISINNQLFLEEEAKIHVSDLSVQRGFGIFDFLKTINGKPIFIEDHFNRFYNSAKELNITVPYSKENLFKAINDLMEGNNLPNSGLKIILTGGFSPDGYLMAEPNLIITQTPFKLDETSFYKGMRLITYNHQRQLANVKTIDYLQAIRLQPLVKQQLADDILYHQDGSVRECPRANFFIVKDKTISTPKTSILWGITRSKILNFKIDGYEIVAEDFTLDDVKNADEAFITSSTKNVMPILNIDGKDVGDGKVGAVTSLIKDEFKSLLQKVMA
ncbi:MAG: amino acid aminotransferase [Flavobacterium sp.]|nr:MAG: amino acid aminotransferase [Flavobacterium sp.]